MLSVDIHRIVSRVSFEVNFRKSTVKSQLRKINPLFLQVCVFDDSVSVKALAAKDVWVVVGPTNYVLPAVRNMPSIHLVVPESGTLLWADLWVSDSWQTSAPKTTGRTPLYRSLSAF